MAVAVSESVVRTEALLDGLMLLARSQPGPAAAGAAGPRARSPGASRARSSTEARIARHRRPRRGRRRARPRATARSSSGSSRTSWRTACATTCPAAGSTSHVGTDGRRRRRARAQQRARRRTGARRPHDGAVRAPRPSRRRARRGPRPLDRPGGRGRAPRDAATSPPQPEGGLDVSVRFACGRSSCGGQSPCPRRWLPRDVDALRHGAAAAAARRRGAQRRVDARDAGDSRRRAAHSPTSSTAIGVCDGGVPRATVNRATLNGCLKEPSGQPAEPGQRERGAHRQQRDRAARPTRR